MTEHGRYGDTPLGKSDEELREEGADAQTNSERQHGAAAGSEAEPPIVVPIMTNAMEGQVNPGLVVSDADLKDELRDEH
ncbi:hypothetical protein GCM10022631_41350 [Deinococcus rubellus]|uniref:Uncharacterized protein n=1 Tax=Deinococcus rubellus TaxID=1889240 RepID=A0ABY5YFS1_9DEIO|nr:hypothetical protein [Deinococcus rubellus]UWX63917.1 hypothetical protein N0D28_14530 [Deinococcus rubellus]